jgi:predicted flavoprotein YhiN
VTLIRGNRTVHAEEGELLFRNYGLSGILIFNLSRFVCGEDRVLIDLFPDYSEEQLVLLLRHREEVLTPLNTTELLDGLLHPRIAQLFESRRLPVEPGGLPVAALAASLKGLQLRVTSGPASGQAQVMRGGWAVEGFEAQTLASKAYPGLYAAGECLDVDGPCGGYNLHWAFASGIVAGREAALSLRS